MDSEKELLDYEGLATLVEQIKDKFPTKTDVSEVLKSVKALEVWDDTETFDLSQLKEGFYVFGKYSYNVMFTPKVKFYTGANTVTVSTPTLFFYNMKHYEDAENTDPLAIFYGYENSGNLNIKRVLYRKASSQGTGVTQEIRTLDILGFQTGFISRIDQAQQISAVKTFNVLPQSNQTPSNNKDLVTKLYVDTAIGGMATKVLDTSSTVAFGDLVKSTYIADDGQNLLSDITMTFPDHLTSTTFTDIYILYVLDTYANASDSDTIAVMYGISSGSLKRIEIIKNSSETAGITYTTLTESLVDTSSFVQTSGAQTISGVKTFTALPQSSAVPSNNDDLVNKQYIDTIVGNINNVLATVTVPSQNE
ncbi:MAG: hypothetical protein J6T15_05190 [Bacilli bacterium]|nr:hypothetical protein [Bacilli bacterium]